jgi:hypothetical protein
MQKRCEKRAHIGFYLGWLGLVLGKTGLLKRGGNLNFKQSLAGRGGSFRPKEDIFSI